MFEIPILFFSFESSNTSIPLVISNFLIKYVLQKLAHAPATPLTQPLSNKSFLPVAVLTKGAVIYLRGSATPIEEKIAAQYPLNKS